MQRGAVVLVRVVLVFAFFPERGEFGGVDGFVVMKRARVELWNAQSQREDDCQQQPQCAPTIHLSLASGAACELRLSAKIIPSNTANNAKLPSRVPVHLNPAGLEVATSFRTGV